ncbi:MAG TPA: hypothetical protein PK890_06740 [Terrimesophilobacter sp.]|nr:hypothetical protein [Terrimesophilobacter sp.]
MPTDPEAVEPAPVMGSSRRDRIEAILSRSVGVVGVLFGAMAFPVALDQRELLQPLWFWVVLVAIYGSLLLNVVASIAKRFVRSANVAVSLLWLLTMGLWPLFVADPDVVTVGRAWPWFLASVAVAAAAVAYVKVRPPIVYLLLAVAVYGYVRVLPAGGGAPWDEMLLDVLSTVTFGGAVITIATVFRHAASRVDEAQFSALLRHSEAAMEDAVGRERVRVDSLVHDSVLTTLREAARASTPEAMALSARIAAEALGHLEAAGSVSDASPQLLAAGEFAGRLESAVKQLARGVPVRVGALAGLALPVTVADALHSAAMQAFVNSLQHTGGSAARWVAVHGVGDEGVRVEVGDTGVGFVSDELPGERIGLRVSVVERVAAVGGSVEIDSQPGEGTIVTLEWRGVGDVGGEGS